MTLTSRNVHCLLEFNPCTLHKIHNAFHRGIVSLEQDKEGLASEKTAVDNKKISTISSHLEEQAKIRNEIRRKRKSV